VKFPLRQCSQHSAPAGRAVPASPLAAGRRHQAGRAARLPLADEPLCRARWPRANAGLS